jgi:hypothetical protein
MLWHQEIELETGSEGCRSHFESTNCLNLSRNRHCCLQETRLAFEHWSQLTVPSPNLGLALADCRECANRPSLHVLENE